MTKPAVAQSALLLAVLASSGSAVSASRTLKTDALAGSAANPARPTRIIGSTAPSWKPDKVNWHPVKDPNTGVLQWHWPLPEGWVTAPPNQDRTVYVGPDGIAVSVYRRR